MLIVTDADYMLAAELDLVLVKQLETDADRKQATDPRATRVPETWTVRSTLTKKPVGRIHFTSVDCLYATKLAAGISGPSTCNFPGASLRYLHGDPPRNQRRDSSPPAETIEETVADALRWMAPILRHARTGEYDGTETVMIGGNLITRPRALTECGAKATGADFSPVAAKSAIVNGEAGEMCRACRARLDTKGARNPSAFTELAERRGSSSPRQRDFVRRLLDEGDRHGRPCLIDARTIDQMSSRGASAVIDALKLLKARDWKGDL